MLLDEAAEKRVSDHYARIWTGLKLRFTAKYFSEGALQSDSTPACPLVALRALLCFLPHCHRHYASMDPVSPHAATRLL